MRQRHAHPVIGMQGRLQVVPEKTWCVGVSSIILRWVDRKIGHEGSVHRVINGRCLGISCAWLVQGPSLNLRNVGIS